MRLRDCGNLLALAVVLCSCVGCRAQQLRHDQDYFRAHLLDMQTNQIMDNLVRAYRGLPIVHLDYRDIAGTITQTGRGDVSGTFTIGGPVRHLWNAMMSASQVNQLAVTANPVLNDNSVYDAYLEFLDKPGRFLVSVDEPPCEAVHLMVCVEGLYYWVPAEYKHDFLELALKSTVLRGGTTSVPTAYENTFVGFLEPPGEGEQQPNAVDSFEFKVKFARPVPNDTGWFESIIDGTIYRFDLLDNEELDDKKDTSVLRLSYTFGPELKEGEIPVTPAQLRAQLPGQNVQINLDRFRPGVRTTEALLDSIRREVQLFRLGQQAGI